MVVNVDDINGLFCPDDDVKHVELVDVGQMDDPESISFDCDVEVDG